MCDYPGCTAPSHPDSAFHRSLDVDILKRLHAIEVELGFIPGPGNPLGQGHIDQIKGRIDDLWERHKRGEKIWETTQDRTTELYDKFNALDRDLCDVYSRIARLEDRPLTLKDRILDKLILGLSKL
jgi:hypothetical protein